MKSRCRSATIAARLRTVRTEAMFERFHPKKPECRRFACRHQAPGGAGSGPSAGRKERTSIVFRRRPGIPALITPLVPPNNKNPPHPNIEVRGKPTPLPRKLQPFHIWVNEKMICLTDGENPHPGLWKIAPGKTRGKLFFFPTNREKRTVFSIKLRREI